MSAHPLPSFPEPSIRLADGKRSRPSKSRSLPDGLFYQTTVHYLDAAGERVPASIAARGNDGRELRIPNPAVVKTVKVAGKKIWGGFRDEFGRRRKVPLSTDKRAAEKMLSDLKTAAEYRRCGLRPINEEHLSRPLAEHLADYERHLTSKDNTAEYVELTIARLRAVFDGCGFRLLKDLRSDAACEWLHQARTYARPLELGAPLSTPCKHATAKTYRDVAAHFHVTVSTVEKWKREGAPLGKSRRKNAQPSDLEAIRQWRLERMTAASLHGRTTSNHYARALRSFGKWLQGKKRSLDNPFIDLEAAKDEGELRHERRELSEADFARLIEATRTRTTRGGRGARFRKLDGADRAMLYLVAANTGFRAGELASLTEASLDLAA
ncbi:MAG: hypothetical protein ACREHD_14415, partial [Pirellulales bacterium]